MVFVVGRRTRSRIAPVKARFRLGLIDIGSILASDTNRGTNEWRVHGQADADVRKAEDVWRGRYTKTCRYLSLVVQWLSDGENLVCDVYSISSKHQFRPSRLNP